MVALAVAFFVTTKPKEKAVTTTAIAFFVATKPKKKLTTIPTIAFFVATKPKKRRRRCYLAFFATIEPKVNGRNLLSSSQFGLSVVGLASSAPEL